MKATRRTIPGLAERMQPFSNTSGTLRGIVNPPEVTNYGKLDDIEIAKLRVDQDQAGIRYLIVSYETPIAWVTKTGWTYKVRQSFTQTTAQHMALLYTLPEGYDSKNVVSP